MYEDFFQKRLAQLRLQKGISARDMSLSIGQNPGYINNIESGKALPSMAAFFYICEFLGVTPQEFFDTEAQLPELLRCINANLKKLNANQLQSLAIIVDGLAR